MYAISSPIPYLTVPPKLRFSLPSRQRGIHCSFPKSKCLLMSTWVFEDVERPMDEGAVSTEAVRHMQVGNDARNVRRAPRRRGGVQGCHWILQDQRDGANEAVIR